ncbi:MAG TPA: TetR/AcrR family transcriptional regulator [Solirubrobacteraceae bacterium]|jgi:AcrR family transcriptional regulator|nr:TetR/AcrR family transcriptional regulator [Solirubrobacteraceae bacterium]
MASKLQTTKTAPAQQRERLLKGMAKAVARRGYTDATVAQAIAYAGVSRSTFYEHFADKQECFLATFSELAPVLGKQLLEAVQGVPWEQKPGVMLAVVLDPSKSEAAMHWRLLLTQARAGEPRIRAAREQFAERLERAFEVLLEGPPQGIPTLDIPPKALLGGMRSVIATRRYTHEGPEQGQLGNDLETWAASYAVPSGYARRSSAAWAELGASLSPKAVPRPSPASAAGLPRGRNRLPANVVASEHHNRIVQATARVMREKGYTATTIADIVTAAGTSRGVFYSHFQNKQEVFLAAQTMALEKGLTSASAAFFTGRGWPQQVWNGLDALLGYIASLPDLAHLMLIEPYAAGRAALDRVIDTMRTLSLFLEEGYHRGPRAERLPRTCSDAIAGAIHELLYHAAQNNQVAELRELLPQAVYVALAPFLGPVKAREAVDEMAASAAAAVGVPLAHG